MKQILNATHNKFIGIHRKAIYQFGIDWIGLFFLAVVFFFAFQTEINKVYLSNKYGFGVAVMWLKYNKCETQMIAVEIMSSFQAEI